MSIVTWLFSDRAKRGRSFTVRPEVRVPQWIKTPAYKQTQAGRSSLPAGT